MRHGGESQISRNNSMILTGAPTGTRFKEIIELDEVSAHICDIRNGTYPPFDSLCAEETARVRGIMPRRQQAFAAGRWCARRALQNIGCKAKVIPVGAHGQPIWPTGTCGSISHSDDWAVALAAPSAKFRSLGVDIEAWTVLPPGLDPIIDVSASERRHWATIIPENYVSCLLFSAKESVYKEAHHIGLTSLTFEEVRIWPGSEPNTFTASPSALQSDWLTLGPLSHGRVSIDHGHIITAFIIKC